MISLGEKLMKNLFNIKMNKQLKNDFVGYAFALPHLILFTTFTIIPVCISLFLSFTSFNVLQPPKFVFLHNYLKLFLEDKIFLLSVKNTIVFSAITGPVSYMLCFFFGWCLNQIAPKLRAFLTLCIYAPTISGNAYLIWTLLFNGDSYGIVNGFLLKLGLINEPILFFQNPKYMIPLIIIIILWMSLGAGMLVFIAGFQGIDKSLYEAASVDGIRNRWQELWYITLPSMKPQLIFGAVLQITASFGVGNVITDLAGFPSYDYAAHTMMNHLHDYGFLRFEMGYASAIATILFLLMIGSNVLVRKIVSKVGQ